MLKKIFFILIPLIIIGSHLGQRIKIWYLVKKDISELKANINRLEKEKENLENKKEFYQTEEFIRREAREKLGLTENNELIVILPNIPDLPDNQIGYRISPNSPTWKKWWNLFFASK